MLDLWAQFGHDQVNSKVQIEWYISVMTACWMVLHERNSIIFSQNFRGNVSLLSSVLTLTSLFG